jgi:hypothetical protein
MAQSKLQPHHRHGQLMQRLGLACFMSLFAWLQGCAHASDRMGMTLLFMNKSRDYIVVTRFDPDGQRGPTPGAVGVGGKAQMSFMPGDSQRGVPQFLEVAWEESTPQAQAALDRLPKLEGVVSAEKREIRKKSLDEAYALRHRYTRRIALTPILTPELLAQVRANRSTTHLKLTVVFQGDQVNITATPEVWRK